MGSLINIYPEHAMTKSFYSCYVMIPEQKNHIFDNVQDFHFLHLQLQDDYFMTSGDKIRFFYEQGAFNDKGI